LRSLPTHPSFGRQTFRPLFERGGFAEPVYILAVVDSRTVMHGSECSLDTDETQSGERRDSASVYARVLETELK